MLEFIAFSPLFEIIAIVIVVVSAVLAPRRALVLIRGLERGLSRLALRRALSSALLALIVFVLAMALSLVGRFPQPIVHDEFAYLLSADTFAHGRLTNPTHPLWMHFESFHIIHQPSYQAKYPPVQGLILAAGQVIAHPIVGVWLSTAIACAAIYWMLLAWAPPWAALLAGLMTALHPALVLIWSQIYWGGQVAMIGGALVFGALRHIMRVPRARDGLLMGIGLALLASRRPYEGFIATLPAAILLLRSMFAKDKLALRIFVRRTVLPIVLVLAATVLWTGYYNWRVTGDPLRPPYVVYETTYGVGRFFIWQHASPLPAYRHKVMRDFYQGELDSYSAQESLSGVTGEIVQKLRKLWLFYDGIRPLRWCLVIPLLALPWLLPNRWTRFAMATLALFIVGVLALTWSGAHFAGPIVGVMIILGVQGVRSLRLWRWKKIPIGRFVLWALAAVVFATFVANYAAAIIDKRDDQDPSWHFERARFIEELSRKGRHLIIVRYGANHDPYEEWVYNDADIDGATVVWAREMTPIEDKKLLDYFKDRKVWLLDVGNDEWPPKLTAYSSISLYRN